ncbi:MAG: ribose transport system ATP-binding protein [Ilumatobacteraceae bacterium]
MQPLLTIEHLTKIFPGQVALDDVTLTINAGRTHALVGQNGSGKSTLIKILAGYHQPTGDVTATYFGSDGDGAPLHLGDHKSAESHGIRFVHQDLGLVDTLTTVENLALGTGFATTFGGRIHWKAETQRARAALADLGFDDFDVTAPIGTLAPSQKTAVALARALRGWEEAAHLLVLDEPTASLPGADVQRLFAAIRILKARGVAILYVSHHLDEVFEIADEVTVLRDGKVIATLDVHDLNHDKLIELMIGHKVTVGTSSARRIDDVVRLDVKGISGGNVDCLDLQLHSGEVVGIAGITGSGRESIVPLIAGHVPTTGGTVEINGVVTDNYAPHDTVEAGACYLAADRTAHGVFKLFSVIANTTISDVKRNTKFGRLLHKQERREAKEWIDKLRVKTAGAYAAIGTLSGGNQQKVLFARGLRLNPTVIMLDEPTRGIDVGAKEEIHALIDQAAAGGAAVLVVSTDTDEIVRTANRVLIMRGGKIAAEFTGDDITTEKIERAQMQTGQVAPTPSSSLTNTPSHSRGEGS